jgi:hypothetical protein
MLYMDGEKLKKEWLMKILHLKKASKEGTHKPTTGVERKTKRVERSGGGSDPIRHHLRRAGEEKMAATSLVSSLTLPLVSAVLGGAIAILFLAGYLRRKRAAIAHIPPSAPDQPKHVRPSNQQKKGNLRQHHHAADKVCALSIHPHFPRSPLKPLFIHIRMH